MTNKIQIVLSFKLHVKFLRILNNQSIKYLYADFYLAK